MENTYAERLKDSLEKARYDDESIPTYSLGFSWFLRSMAVVIVHQTITALKTCYPTVTIKGDTLEGTAIENPSANDVLEQLCSMELGDIRSLSLGTMITDFAHWLLDQPEPDSEGEYFYPWFCTETITDMYNKYVQERNKGV